MRRLETKAEKGFQRVAWNLRRAPVDAWERSAEEDEWSDGSEAGAMVAPGTYSVSMALLRGGQLTPCGEARSFEVKALGGGALEGASPAEVAAFQAELAEVARDVSAHGARASELIERCEAMASVLRRTPGAAEELRVAVHDLHGRLTDLRHRLTGDPRQGTMNEQGPVSIDARMSHADLGVKFSTYGPTPSHRESLRIAREAAAEVGTALGRIRDAEMPRLDAALEAAGAPWTPGR